MESQCLVLLVICSCVPHYLLPPLPLSSVLFQRWAPISMCHPLFSLVPTPWFEPQDNLFLHLHGFSLTVFTFIYFCLLLRIALQYVRLSADFHDPKVTFLHVVLLFIVVQIYPVGTCCQLPCKVAWSRVEVEERIGGEEPWEGVSKGERWCKLSSSGEFWWLCLNLLNWWRLQISTKRKGWFNKSTTTIWQQSNSSLFRGQHTNSTF